MKRVKPAPQSQVTDTILMVRPAHFGYNPETAENNSYQKLPESHSPEEVQRQALAEFNSFEAKLRAAGVEVIVVDDISSPPNTDSIFPNNWISTHEDGVVVTYPMWAPSRRRERREDIIDELTRRNRVVSRRVDYSPGEAGDRYLEGTGSMILDRANATAYACVSPRTHPELFLSFCSDFGFTPVIFRASQEIIDGSFMDVYHTNVMMSVGENIAIVCSDAIRDASERENVLGRLRASGREIVTITTEQCTRFAGNMLQVKNRAGERLLVMSDQAYQSLTTEQITQILERTSILHSPLDMIETCGGGGARCMIAEIFLPRVTPQEADL